MAVIDASVLISCLLPEELGQAASLDWLNDAIVANEPLAAPAIVLAEVSAAVARRTNRPEMADWAVQRLRSAGHVQMTPVTEALATRAAEIAANQRIRGCDAVYVALARDLGQTLVTWDAQQLERGAEVATVTRPEAPRS